MRKAVVAGIAVLGGALWWMLRTRRNTLPPKTVNGIELLDLPEGTRVAVRGAFSQHGGGGSDPPSRPAYGIVIDRGDGSYSVGQWVVGIPPARATEGTLITVIGTVRIAKDMGYATGLQVPGEPINDPQSDMQYLEAEHVEVL